MEIVLGWIIPFILPVFVIYIIYKLVNEFKDKS